MSKNKLSYKEALAHIWCGVKGQWQPKGYKKFKTDPAIAMNHQKRMAKNEFKKNVLKPFYTIRPISLANQVGKSITHRLTQVGQFFFGK